MLRPPSLEETVGGLTEQFSEILSQRLAQVSVDLRGSYARMAQEELDDADIHTTLEHVRGEAVPERVRPELVIEAALASRLVESGPCGGVWQVRDDATTGKQPRPAAMDLPDLSKHLQDGVCQREGPLLVSFADNVQYHLLRVDRRDRKRDRLLDP